jgi:predicted metal-dependent hydrolase
MIDGFRGVVKYFRVVRRRKRARSTPRRSSVRRKEFLEHKEQARAIVQQRIEHFNALYSFSVGTIRIKNQKSRWGSCSKKGNLNFNYRIALLPERLIDYIVVHELCHLGEFNHSQNFWNLVARTIPDFALRRAELKKIHVR